MKVVVEFNEKEQEIFGKYIKISSDEDEVIDYKFFIAVRGLFETLSQNNAESVLCMVIEEMAAKNKVTFREYVERLIEVSEEITSMMGEYKPIW